MIRQSLQRLSLGFVLFLLQCAAPNDEMDREPIVEKIHAGPLLLRYYASPTSTGGAATRFSAGESIFLVDTMENDSGEIAVCKLPSHNDNSPMSTPCGSPMTKAVKQGTEIIWSDRHDAICPFSHGFQYPELITFPASVSERKYTEVRKKVALAKGKYDWEWYPGRGLSWPTICSFPLEATVVTIPIEIF